MTTDPGREVPLKAGDATYTLYAGNRALRMVERETGEPITALASPGAEVKISVATTILWALLSRHHPDLTVDACDDIIDTAGYAAVTTAIETAMAKAFPTETAAMNGAGPGKARRGTGMKS